MLKFLVLFLSIFGCFTAKSNIYNPVDRIYTIISIDSIKNTMDIQTANFIELVLKQEQVIKFSEKIYPIDSPEIAYEYESLSYYLSKCERYTEAIKYARKASEIFKILGNNYESYFLEALGRVALYLYLNEDLDLAVNKYTQLLNIYQQEQYEVDDLFINSLKVTLSLYLNNDIDINIDDIIDYFLMSNASNNDKLKQLGNIIGYFYSTNNIQKAIQIFKYLEQIIVQDENLQNKEEYADALLNITKIYIDLGEFDDAKNSLNKAISIYILSNTYNRNEAFIEHSLGDIAFYNRIFDDAIFHYKNSITSMSFDSIGTVNQLCLLNNLARCYMLTCDYEHSYVYIKKALFIINNNVDDLRSIEIDRIIDILDIFGILISANGQFEEGLNMLNMLITNHSFNEYQLDEIYLQMGQIYALQGDKENALNFSEKLYTSILNSSKCLNDSDKGIVIYYINKLIRLSEIYYTLEKLSVALHLLNHANEICEKFQIDLEEVEEYIVLLLNLGSYNISLGNYEEAKRLELKALSFLNDSDNSIKNNKAHLLAIYSNLFLISCYQEDNINANLYADKVICEMKDSSSFLFKMNANFFQNLMSYYVKTNNLLKAKIVGDLLKEGFNEIYKNNPAKYYASMYPFIYFYNATGDYEYLIKLCHNILDNVTENKYRETAIAGLISAFASTQNYNEIPKLLAQLHELECNDVKNAIAHFESLERLSLIDKYRGGSISIVASILDDMPNGSEVKSRIVSNLYNSILLYKGLNLCIDIHLLRSTGQDFEFLVVDDVIGALKKNECAIEFMEYNKNETTYYGAIIVKSNGFNSFIPICKSSDLFYNNPNLYYTDTLFANLIWGKLYPYLSDIQTVFFAPCGALNNIAIENVLDIKGNGVISDRFEMYRLSSTRELINKKEKQDTTNVALYGGLNFDFRGITFEKNLIMPTNNIAITRSNPDSIGLRAGYGFLEGSRIEVDSIKYLFENKSIVPQIFTDTIGTERSLKNLSGKGITNLHIATHGFYWNETEVLTDWRKELSFIRHENTPHYTEDKAMTRSGLLFAGANAALQGDSIPEWCDDGILTAQEISTLDFRGLDLLVLSACQTGLGEIKGDGVFGLQRGFKKAGAQTIVMSLWKVDDEATQMLMTAFYENLLAGKSKRESLLHAQDKVRNFVGEINGTMRDFWNPKYWAGFIMLDALN